MSGPKADLPITDGQLQSINFWIKTVGLTRHEGEMLCRKHYACAPFQLTRGVAAAFIDFLKSYNP